MQTYDAIVIGSGQGGSPLAHKLADLGQRVAIVEREHLGGSCINYGCTPTKTMIASARVAHYARRAAEFGVHTGEVTVNLSEVVARKNAMVQQWRDGQQAHIDKRPTLDLIRGHARFTGAREVEVDGESYTAERIFINTGTRPLIPNIPGIEAVEYLTNRNVMDLEELPGHLIILGGNYLGLEFGQMFRRFGSRVSVVEINDQVTPREDEDVATSLREALEDEGLVFHLGSRTTAIAKTADGVAITIERKDGSRQSLTGTHLLAAIGQAPNTEDLGLERAGIETDDRGYITHNDKLETTAPGVWVIGDVKGGPAFTHVSYDDHLVIYDNLVEGKERSIEGRIIPYALFTDPELGRAGMSEREARAAGYRIKVGTMPMEWVARAIERSETKGMAKVVIDADTDLVLGATFLGPEGGDVVQTLLTLMRAGAPWTLFDKAMFTHPTMTEGYFTLMGTVQDA